jgi:hypothetical protein
VRAFPFPFPRDAYRYSANVEPALAPRETEVGSWGRELIAVDGAYRDELAERARILAADPERCITLPHMTEAVWDAVDVVLSSMARDHPEHFALRRDGELVTWTNRPLGEETTFRPGDEASFRTGDAPPRSVDPLAWLGAQVQEDICLLDQRDDELWLDAGILTFPADWSLAFDVGMSFREFHGPVPRAPEEGIFAKAERFLVRLQPGAPYRRTNWTLTVDGRLDTATELYDVWGRDRAAVTAENAGDRVFLRVEVQHLVRLPVSGAIMFLIATKMLPLREIALVPAWAERTRSVLAELPQDMTDYKGFARFRDHAVAWLDGARR